MSSLRLRQARDEDIHAMAALDVSAFLDSPMRKAMFPERLRVKPGVQDQVEWNISRMRKGLADPNLHYLVILASRPEGGDIIVGCAEWSAPATDDGLKEEEQKTAEEKARDMELRLARLPACLDKGAVLDASDEVMELLEKSGDALEGKNRYKMWTLNSICVDGDYRGIGIGKMLTRWGIERANEDKTDIWVISSSLGRPLYQSLGFQQIAEGSRCGEPQYVMFKHCEPK